MRISVGAATAAGALVVAALTGWTGAARAQGSISFNAVAGAICDAGEPCGGGVGGCDGGERCALGRAGGGVCVPMGPGVLVCCGSDDDCPAMGEAGAPLTCQLVDGLMNSAGIAQGVCTPVAAPWCQAGDLPTLSELTACVRHPSTDTQTTFDYGDCDGDGIQNIYEQTYGTDLCQAPVPRAIDDDDGGCELVQNCDDDPDTDPSCQITDDGSGPSGTCTITAEEPTPAGLRCEPDEGTRVFCGPGQGFACLQDEVEVFVRGRSYCTVNRCLGHPSIDPANCIMNEAGDLAPYREGDCDLDGEKNEDEEDSAERDPCVDEDMPAPDAGPQPDAGPVADAGAPSDAGATPPIDGGGVFVDSGTPGTDPRFEGGGGCSCRVRPSGGAGALPATLGLLGFALLFWRRRE